jgi:hypothetical protein
VVGITFFILVFLVSLIRLVSAVRVSRLVRGAVRLETTSASSSQSICARILHRQGNLSSFISRQSKVIPSQHCNNYGHHSAPRTVLARLEDSHHQLCSQFTTSAPTRHARDVCHSLPQLREFELREGNNHSSSCIYFTSRHV